MLYHKNYHPKENYPEDFNGMSTQLFSLFLLKHHSHFKIRQNKFACSGVHNLFWFSFSVRETNGGWKHFKIPFTGLRLQIITSRDTQTYCLKLDLVLLFLWVKNLHTEKIFLPAFFCTTSTTGWRDKNDKSIGSFLGYNGGKEYSLNPFSKYSIYIPIEDTNIEEMEGTLLSNNMSVTVTMQITESILNLWGLLYQAVGMK